MEHAHEDVVNKVTYDTTLVVLSICLGIMGGTAFVASFASLTSGAKQAMSTTRIAISSGLFFGLVNVWCLHFVGMAAMQVDGHDITYIDSMTLLSMGFALVGPAVAMVIGLRLRASVNFWLRCILFGALLVLSALAMHFTGLAASRIPDLRMRWAKEGYLTSAIVIAVVTAPIAGFIPLFYHERMQMSALYELIGGSILGLDVAAIHFLTTLSMEWVKVEPGESLAPGTSAATYLAVAAFLALLSCSLSLLLPWQGGTSTTNKKKIG